MAEHGYGWVPQLPDARDWRLSVPEAAAALPPAVDLRPQMPPVYDQGRLGSCTANAIGAAVQHARARAALPDFTPSRLFIYYGERALEHTVRSDAGAAIRDGFKVIAHTGAPPEDLWPYDITQFARKPPKAAYAAAKLDLATAYYAVPQTRDALRACLAGGCPIVVGFAVYASFESRAVALSGVAPLPAPGEALLGGHAVLVVGYDDAAGTWRCRNSWGAGWGQAGYFTLPYGYLTDPRLASDFWTLKAIGAPAAAPGREG